MGGEYLPLLSNARFSAFERLGECRDGVESGGGEGGVGEEGAGGCHVVFAPLEVAAWLFGERVVLGYGFTCRPICNKGILHDGNTEWLENLEETHSASSKHSAAKALDHCLSPLLETVAAE